MTTKTQNVEGVMEFALGKSRNCLIPWFLITSYAYYQRDVSLISDARYDQLARELDAEWDSLEHRHKSLIDRAALKAGTAYQIARYPEMVIGAACLLAGIDRPSLAPGGTPPKTRVKFTIKKKPAEPAKKITRMVFGRKKDGQPPHYERG